MDASRTRRRPASDARSRKRMRRASITVNAAIVPVRRTGERLSPFRVRIIVDMRIRHRHRPPIEQQNVRCRVGGNTRLLADDCVDESVRVHAKPGTTRSRPLPCASRSRAGPRRQRSSLARSAHIDRRSRARIGPRTGVILPMTWRPAARDSSRAWKQRSPQERPRVAWPCNALAAADNELGYAAHTLARTARPMLT